MDGPSSKTNTAVRGITRVSAQAENIADIAAIAIKANKKFHNMVEAGQDRSKIFLLAFTLGLSTLAFIVAKTGRDALFFQGSGGLLQLPLVYINIAAASLPLALIFVKAMKVWSARLARIGILSLTAGVMAAAAPFLRPGDNTLLLIMFMFIPAIFGRWIHVSSATVFGRKPLRGFCSQDTFSEYDYRSAPN